MATIGQNLGSKRPVISVPLGLSYWACRAIGILVRDVIITREEIQGLMEGRLRVDAPPLRRMKLTDWIRDHRASLGRRYTSEIARRGDRASSYSSNSTETR